MFLNIPNSDLPSVRHATEVGNVCSMREMLRADISCEGDMIDLFCFYLACPISFF